jgi:hypothetical protein
LTEAHAKEKDADVPEVEADELEEEGDAQEEADDAQEKEADMDEDGGRGQVDSPIKRSARIYTMKKVTSDLDIKILKVVPKVAEPHVQNVSSCPSRSNF